MNTLNLEIINRHAPYIVTQNTDYPHLFYFHTDYDIEYEISINTYEHRDQYVIKTAEGKMDGVKNFMAIIIRKDNPRLQQASDEFEETVAFLFD